MRTRHLPPRGFALAFALCLSTSPAASTDPDCSGEPSPMPGSGKVDGGEAIYTIGIDAPRDDDAPSPNVSLEYSSRSGPRTAGMGWTVAAGLSSIFRCPPTLSHDGYADKVRYTDGDRICLDGDRLVLVEGEFGKDGSQYVTEIYDGRHVFLRGAINSEQSGFMVRDADDDSWGVYDWTAQPDGAPYPLRWHRRRLIQGESSIDYRYEHAGPGESVIAEIRYPGTRSTTGWRPGEHFVRFRYTLREDVGSLFISRGEERYTRLLVEIVTGTEREGELPLRHASYALDYRPSLSTGRPLLTTVAGGHYDAEGGYRCRQPTGMVWIDHPVRFAEPTLLFEEGAGQTTADAWAPGRAAPLPALLPAGDVDGDGRADILDLRDASRATVLRIGMDLRVEQAATVPPGVLPLSRPGAIGSADWRGIGASDLTAVQDGHLVTVGWQGDGLSGRPHTGIGFDRSMAVVDFDHDGLPDLVAIEAAETGPRILIRRGRVMSPQQTEFGEWQPIATLPSGGPDPVLESPGALTGLSPTIVVREAGRISHILDLEPDRNRRPSARLWSAADFGIEAEARASGRFAEVNGDGMPDLVFTGPDGRWRVQINAGDGFLPSQDAGLPDSRPASARLGTLFADIDMDGRDEILFPATRLQDYCLSLEEDAPVCGDLLAERHPEMDLGIYRYQGLRFRQDRNGQVRLQPLPDLELVAQTHRTVAFDVDGDGWVDVISMFDPGVANGMFKAADGGFSPCPQAYGCGARIASQHFMKRPDRRDGNLDTLRLVRGSLGMEHEWHYFTLANPVRALYTLPALDDPHRYLGPASIHFRSSMYVVGDFERRVAGRRTQASFSYGAATYNRHGRGIEGFKWIARHHGTPRERQVWWFRQAFPFTGRLERYWIEPDRDGRRDFFDGRAGRRALASESITWHCRGPADHPATGQAGCEPHEHPTFEVLRGRPDGASR